MAAAHRRRLRDLAAHTGSASCLRALGRGAAVVGLRGATLAACVLRIKGLDALVEAGLPAPSAAVEVACADRSGRGPAEATLLGRIARAGVIARARIGRHCGSEVSARKVLALVGCAAEDIVSATFEGAKVDLSRYQARPGQGGRPLDSYFPCLAGGAAGHEHAHE
jgi:hypothetical protein